MEEDKVRMEESAFYFPILLQIIRMTDLSDVEPHTELLTILTDTVGTVYPTNNHERNGY